VAEAENRVVLARSKASAGARAYNGGLVAEHERGSRGRAPGGGSGGGAKPPEADGIVVLEHTVLRSPGGFLHSCKL